VINRPAYERQHTNTPGYSCIHPSPVVLAKHHWQRELLLQNTASNRKTVTTFLNCNDATEIQHKYTGFSKVTDNCNRVKTILSLKRAPGKPKDAVKFVQAPISTKEDVESFVRDLISKKALLIQK
jgi:cyclophilin family peptidyl-prolyl cis-trans isomerase